MATRTALQGVHGAAQGNLCRYIVQEEIPLHSYLEGSKEEHGIKDNGTLRHEFMVGTFSNVKI